MRRLSLSTKLFAAALPLIIAVGGLLALTVRSDLEEIDRAESGADLGGVWAPLIAALNAVEAEADTLDGAGAADGAGADDVATGSAGVRRATDQAINELRTAVEQLGAFEAASSHVTAGRSALSAARRNADMAAIAPDMATEVDPVEAYGVASREFVAVGQLLPSEAGDAELGRELLAVVKLAEAKLHANDVLAGTRAWANDSSSTAPLTQARTAYANLITTFGEFQAIAPGDWGTEFRQSGFTTTLGRFNTDLTTVARGAEAGGLQTFDSTAFDTFIDQVVDFERTISQSIVDGANAEADATRTATLRRIGIILAVVLVAGVIAWFITRSVTRRVKAVANSANRIAADQLPALVEALRDPRGKALLPDIEPVDAKGGDDLADLARAFNSMQETLIDVAHEQVEVLRRGVSDIFITMARRNRSLIDRQLSMLDEFEASVDDHEVLSNYYQLDHLATRMRRNSESLLVLANAEPKRRRVKATEIDDVVRASIGEVEDYRRVEIQHLESLQVRGNVVADVSHLLAELLDNATSFSPPGSAVRVGGRRADDSYLLRIVDDGVGIGPDRLAELNELLREPPIVGLSVESTLGISVVSLLANKHGISVLLSAGSPGLTVDVVLPSSLYGPMDAPAGQPGALAIDPPRLAEQPANWNDHAAGTERTVAGEPLRIAEPSEAVEPAVADVRDSTTTSLDGMSFGTTPPADSNETGTPALPTRDATSGPVVELSPEPAATEQSGAEQFELDQATAEHVTAQQPVADRPAADQNRAEPAVSEHIAAEHPAADRYEDLSGAEQFESGHPATAEHVTARQPVADQFDSGHAAAEHDTAGLVAADNDHRGADQYESEQYRSERYEFEQAMAEHGASEQPADDLAGDGVRIPERSPQTEPAVASDAARTATPSDVTPFDSNPARVIETIGSDGQPATELAPEPVAAVEAEAPVAAAATVVQLPPPSARRAEFDVPPAPPITSTGISLRPVSPATARPAPVPTPSADRSATLPTRTQGGKGPEGPDRLAPSANGSDERPVTTSEPGALQAALAAFDSGRAAVKAPRAGTLPTRDRTGDPGPMVDEPQAVTQSRVDPSALRDRLRAFQSEFSSASGDHAGGSDIYTDQNDLGGDPR